MYCHFKANKNNENLVINNNNRLPSLSDCSQGDGKQGILLCWPDVKSGHMHIASYKITINFRALRFLNSYHALC